MNIELRGPDIQSQGQITYGIKKDTTQFMQ